MRRLGERGFGPGAGVGAQITADAGSGLPNSEGADVSDLRVSATDTLSIARQPANVKGAVAPLLSQRN